MAKRKLSETEECVLVKTEPLSDSENINDISEELEHDNSYFLTEEQYTEMVFVAEVKNEPFSDSDDSFDKDLESVISSDSDTDVSDTEIGASGFYTSDTDILNTETVADECYTSQGKLWSRTLKDLKPFDFVGTPNINVINASKEIDFFYHFFDDDLIKCIADETKNSALNHLKVAPSSSKTVKISNVTPGQMKVFIGLIILMGIIKKPNLKMYFSTNEMLSTPFFSKVTSRDVFLTILKHLRFTSDSGARKLDKLGSLIGILQNKFKATYTPEKNICIDESLFPWRGQLFGQYVPSRRSRSGIKIYKLCESSSGYVWNFLVHCGRESASGPGSYGEQVVRSLMSELSGKGHILYVDKFFNSPSLAEYLGSIKTNLCGTVMKYKKNIPRNFPRADLLEGEVDAVQNGNMNLIAYKERKQNVFILTTVHAPDFHKSRKKDKNTGEDILKPTCVLDFNKHMGSFELGEAITTHHPSFRKSVQWYKKLFFGLMDIALMNANVLYDKKHGVKTAFTDFKMKVVEQIFEKFEHCRGERKFPARTSPSPLRLLGRHFPMLNLSKTGVKTRRRCVVCSKKKKQQQTYYSCEICNVGLCVQPCFKVYHTVPNL